MNERLLKSTETSAALAIESPGIQVTEDEAVESEESQSQVKVVKINMKTLAQTFLGPEYSSQVEIENATAWSGAHLAGGGRGQGVWTPAPFQYSPNCTLKFLNQFRGNALKNQFKKRKKPSKRCTNSILLEFFNAKITSAGQKNAELIFEKLQFRKLKFRIFNSMVVIFYLSLHMLSYFRVIRHI